MVAADGIRANAVAPGRPARRGRTRLRLPGLSLVEDGARFPEFLIDQGKADSFLEKGLRPWLFEEAIKGTDIGLTLRMHDRYDHSYYFISTFMDDHLKWHAERLG